MVTETSTQRPVDGHRDRYRSWLSLVLYPLAFLAAFGVGEGLASALGHPVGGDTTPPVWVVLVSTLPALLVFCVPGALALFFGRRALRAGDQAARAPMTIGVVVAVLFVGLNVVSGIVVLATD
jgi:hypothetical protein